MPAPPPVFDDDTYSNLIVYFHIYLGYVRDNVVIVLMSEAENIIQCICLKVYLLIKKSNC